MLLETLLFVLTNVGPHAAPELIPEGLYMFAKIYGRSPKRVVSRANPVI